MQAEKDVIMAITDYFERIERIDGFIRRKATGTAKELAHKLGISKRMIYIYIETMKELGAPIEYNNTDQTYYYTEKGKIHLGFKLTELTKEEQINIGGAFFYQKKTSFLRECNNIAQLMF